MKSPRSGYFSKEPRLVQPGIGIITKAMDRVQAKKPTILRQIAGRDAMPPLHQIREINRFLEQLANYRGWSKRASELARLAE